MDFTKEEKYALIRLFNGLVYADKKVHVNEAGFMQFFYEEFDIIQDDLEESQKLSLLNVLSIVSEMSLDKKLTVSVLASQLAEADGTINDMERRILYDIMKAIGVNPD